MQASDKENVKICYGGGKTEEQVIIDKQTCPLSPLPFDSIQFVSFREKSDGWKMYRMVIIVRNKF